MQNAWGNNEVHVCLLPDIHEHDCQTALTDMYQLRYLKVCRMLLRRLVLLINLQYFFFAVDKISLAKRTEAGHRTSFFSTRQWPDSELSSSPTCLTLCWFRFWEKGPTLSSSCLRVSLRGCLSYHFSLHNSHATGHILLLLLWQTNSELTQLLPNPSF